MVLAASRRLLGDVLPPKGTLPGPVRRSRVPRDVTSVETWNAADEVDPTDVGVEQSAVDAIWDGVRDLYATGINPAIAICLRRDGEIIMDRAIGHARGNGPKDPPDAEAVLATPDTPFTIASASKAVTAMVVHLLDQRGELHVDDRVCEYIPEFAAHGKDAITLNHVLSHRAGVPNIPHEAMDLDLLGDEDHILKHLVDARPLLPAGRFVAYHAISGGFILAEVVKRVTGRTLQEVLREEIVAPLGIETLDYGIASDRIDEVALNYATGLRPIPPISTVLERALGFPVDELTDLMNDRRIFNGVIPAGNIVATARDICQFFELLRNQGELNGTRIFEPRVIRRAVSEQSYMEFDLTLGFPFRYGMGFMLGARVLSLYGPNTHHAFGHLGFTNVVCWADPERRLSGAILTSGKPVVGPHLLPHYTVARRISSLIPRDGLIDGGRDWA